jgi:hypothetical protein
MLLLILSTAEYSSAVARIALVGKYNAGAIKIKSTTLLMYTIYELSEWTRWTSFIGCKEVIAKDKTSMLPSITCTEYPSIS